MVWTMFTAGCTWRSKNASLTLLGGALQRPHDGAILQSMQFSTSDISKNIRQILNFSEILKNISFEERKNKKKYFFT